MLQLNAEDVKNKDKVNRTYQSGHPAGSTALVAASAPTGSWVCELGERLQGIYPEALGTRPVWADSSARAQERNAKYFFVDCYHLASSAIVFHKMTVSLTELIFASSASSA